MNKFSMFVWYLLTEPFVQIKNIFAVSVEKGSTLNYPRTWRFIFFALMVGFYLAGNKLVGNVFLALVVITVIKTEWDSGVFIDKARKRMEKKAEKQAMPGGGQQ